ncbi:MAG: peptide-methionine (S)-S-oxide reductase MsrA [Acidimicrobiia bacterium]|nr:peptide-methionine (S)-S-oxide reductase MsrA [Acidimicrobiia bacterium]MDX2468603.1 peptide-methionine (S)-S-oxide reductase MsrA [Acidimicrobiia bacterium]
MWFQKSEMPDTVSALAGRPDPLTISGVHFVNNNTIVAPFPEGIELAYFAMGCFWGAERIFWQLPGVYSTAVGYAGGLTQNATYEEVCSGQTGHTEVVLVAYDPSQVSYGALLQAFWEGHDPTQGMQQGNDVGTQYRSAIYASNEMQLSEATSSRDGYQTNLNAAGYETITTEIEVADTFYYAEEYHQQYLAKNPNGYCGIGGTGVSCPIGLGA